MNSYAYTNSLIHKEWKNQEVNLKGKNNKMRRQYYKWNLTYRDQLDSISNN